MQLLTNITNRNALPHLPSLLRIFVPNGQIEGDEYVAFGAPYTQLIVDLRTGCWRDARACGMGIVSLLSHLSGAAIADCISGVATILEGGS